MLETLQVGDFLFVNKFEYGPKIPFTHIRLPGLRQPHTGDIIVFQFPQDPSKDYIKRCIATAGQTVEGKDKQVFVDGKPLREPYVIHIDPTLRAAGFDYRDRSEERRVGKEGMFRMGANHYK